MASIGLGDGLTALVDDQDLSLVNQFKWYAARRGVRRPLVYAVGYRRGDPEVLMHRLIMNPPRGLVVDHINGDCLDNRRHNLRICHQRENARNRRAWAGRMAKGVSWRKDIGKWRARLMLNRREIGLGVFDNFDDAVTAYNVAAQKHFASFAKPSEAA